MQSGLTSGRDPGLSNHGLITFGLPPEIQPVGVSFTPISRPSTNFLSDEDMEICPEEIEDQIVPELMDTTLYYDRQGYFMNVNEQKECRHYTFKIEFPPNLNKNILKKYLETEMNLSLKVMTSTDNKDPGIIPYVDITFETITPVDPHHLFEELMRISYLSHRFSVKLDNGELFSNSVISSLNLQLNELAFGSLLPDNTYVKHWIINYVKHENNLTFMSQHFTANLDFGNPKFLINISIFSNNAKKADVLDKYSCQIERHAIRRILVWPKKTENSIRIIVEITQPITLKKKEISKVDQNIYKQNQMPDYIMTNIYRGEKNEEHAADCVLYDQRHILIDLRSNKRYEILSRLREKSKAEIIFYPFTEKTLLYVSSTRKENPVLPFQEYNRNVFSTEEYYESLVKFGMIRMYYNKHDQEINRVKCLIITFRLRALLDLGGSVVDQLLTCTSSWQETDTFVCDKSLPLHQHVARFFIQFASKNFEGAKCVLEAIIKFYMKKGHKANRLEYVINDFCNLYKLNLLNDQQIPENEHFELMETLELTPAGIYYKLPEYRFGNMLSRFLKKRGLQAMIRCSIKGFDGKPIRWTIKGLEKNGKRKIDQLFRKKLSIKLKEAFKFMGDVYSFYGASGSQQKEVGFFLMRDKDQEDIRNAMGDYSKVQNPNKRNAREGQCTSQSMECSIEITSDMFEDEKDIEHNGYCRTDGAGRISVELMIEIANDMKISPCLPTGFQLRFGPYKGMLFLDPSLKGRKIIFRKSQKKYEFGKDFYPFIQIVKFAGPQTTNFCPSYINIIDQNSEKDKNDQKRVREKLLDLNENNINSMAEGFIDEEKFRLTDKNLPFFINIDKLATELGFVLHREPFFVSKQQPKIIKSLALSLTKGRVQVDPSLGRSAFVAPDIYGILEPNEVYYEGTVSINDKYPSSQTPSRIWTGPGMAAKYPCAHPGDVRLVSFVDKTEYHGRRDVIFVSIKGDRPIIDMMSGSDFDGDEVSFHIIQDLLPTTDEEPMDYTADTNVPPNPKFYSQDIRVDTFLRCAEDDLTGLCSMAHLIKSDEHGLKSNVALSLAKKTSQALDMPKSGISPALLTVKWSRINNQPLPPETVYRKPDFKANPSKEPTYRSLRMNGKLHRLNRQLNFLQTIEREDVKDIKISPIMLKIKEKYKESINFKICQEEVKKAMLKYNAKMESIMNDFELDTEGELLSGEHLSGKGKEDEFSNIQIKNISLGMVMDLFREARKEFYTRDGRSWMENTQYDGRYYEGCNEENDIIRRTVKKPTEDMKIRAVLAYVITYEQAKETGKKLLSFAWVAYDSLAYAQKWFNYRYPDFDVKEESLITELEEKIENIYRKEKDMPERTWFEFIEEFKNLPKNCDLIAIMKIYEDKIYLILFALYKWALNCLLIEEDPEQRKKLFRRLLYLAMEVSFGSTFDFQPCFDIEIEQFSPGKVFIQILARLESRVLLKHEKVEFFSNDGMMNVINKKDIKKIYVAARRSYLHLLIIQNLGFLEGYYPYLAVAEREPRVIELPVDDVSLSDIKKMLMAITGAEKMELRRHKIGEKELPRVTVMYRGSFETEERLRRVIEVPPTDATNEIAYYTNTVCCKIMEAFTMLQNKQILV